MDFPKRALPQGSPGRSPKVTRPRAMEADENVSPKHFVAARAESPQRKKVLGERNSGGGGGREAVSPAAPQPKPAPSPPSLAGRGAGTYDPKTNYTTPRPDFLRYNPERSREILLRLKREVEVESSSATSGTATSEAVSSGSSALGSDAECDDLDDGDEEEVVVPVHRGGWARCLFLLLVAVACTFFYIYCMTSNRSPASSEERLNLLRPNGSMYDSGVHQVDYLSGPIDMMDSEDVLEEAIGQIVQRDSENVIYLYGPGGSPRNLKAIALVGTADVCPNVPLGEFTCQVGDENSENVDDHKEGSELGEQKTDMEDKSGLAHQEEGEGYSLQVSLEQALEPGSEELHDGKGLGSEKLDQETEPWEYDSTAEAAKAISAMVKFLWSAMKPHLLHMLASLSVAGFVAAMFKYFQTSRKVPAPVSQHMPSAPPAQVPVLTPHQVAQLPVFSSPQSVQLPMFPSQQSVQLTIPKQEPPVSLELRVHLPLPKPDPFVSFKVPVIDHGNSDQRIRGDVDNMMASDSNIMDHKEIDSLKPPVVELLGEFSFVDAGSSRGRSIKDLNRHGGDATVQESSVSLRKDMVKMQKESSKIQSPSVPRVRKEENAAKVEKMDATPTPLRRSSRLRNRVSS